MKDKDLKSKDDEFLEWVKKNNFQDMTLAELQNKIYGPNHIKRSLEEINKRWKLDGKIP